LRLGRRSSAGAAPEEQEVGHRDQSSANHGESAHGNSALRSAVQTKNRSLTGKGQAPENVQLGKPVSETRIGHSLDPCTGPPR
jgi:hypothetical protein